MRHGVSKAKFNNGIDANRMMLRKLAINFLTHGKIVTTEKRAKILKSHIERIVEKTKEENEANTNFLKRTLGSDKFIQPLFKQVGPVLKDKIGGYVRISKLLIRQSDSAAMAKIEWAYPVLIEKETSDKKAAAEINTKVEMETTKKQNVTKVKKK